MPESYGITKAAFERFQKEVKTGEKRCHNLPLPRPKNIIPVDGKFRANLTGSATYKYSWDKLKWKEIDDLATGEAAWENDPDWVKGDHTEDEGYAVEINGGVDCIHGDIVELFPTGKGYYIFEYKPDLTFFVTGLITIDPAETSSDTPASGTATVYTLDTSSGNMVSGQTATVWNNWQEEIQGNTLIACCYRYGRWIIVASDCEQRSGGS